MKDDLTFLSRLSMYDWKKEDKELHTTRKVFEEWCIPVANFDDYITRHNLRIEIKSEVTQRVFVYEFYMKRAIDRQRMMWSFKCYDTECPVPIMRMFEPL